MSVYIKDKDMVKPWACNDPMGHWGCPLFKSYHPYGYCCGVNRREITAIFSEQPWCPLIPVPAHGRLIDADALSKYDRPIGKMMMFGGEYVYTQTAIDNAPTIIPASKEEE